MASASFHINLKTHADEAHNIHFDLQNSPDHTWPHPITANYSLNIFPFLTGLNPSAISEILKHKALSRIIVLKEDNRMRGAVDLFCKKKKKNSHTIS